MTAAAAGLFAFHLDGKVPLITGRTLAVEGGFR